MHLEALNNKGKEIFPSLKEFKKFYLAGGTALSLQIGHRISVDFDFFCEDDISKDLMPRVKKIFKGSDISVLVNNLDELTLIINGVKITFLKYPFPALSDFILYKGVKFLNIKEISATKAYTIGRRGSYKDYIDLYFIISKKYVSLENIIKMAEKKYGDDFNSRLFLEQLVYFKDIEYADIMFLNRKIEKEDLEKFFENEIKKIKF